MTTHPVRHSIPADILALSHERDQLRRRGHYARADELKKLIEDAGYGIKDNPHGAHLVILPSIEVDGTFYRMSREVPSLLNESDTCLFSVLILVNNRSSEARHCVESVLHSASESASAIEVILVDNASQDDLPSWIEPLQQQTPFLHVIRVSRTMGEAAAWNLALKQSRGRFILQLDPGLELSGDIFTPLAHTLEQEEVGLTGLYGLRTNDLRHFEASSDEEVEAIAGSCVAFRRKTLKKIGLLDENYRFPFFLDIDLAFSIRARGLRAVVTRDLPISQHPVQADLSLSDAERTRLTRRNFYRFLNKWGDRDDLLLNSGEEDETNEEG